MSNLLKELVQYTELLFNYTLVKDRKVIASCHLADPKNWRKK